MKRILKKGLLSILILFLLTNFAAGSLTNVCYAGEFGIETIFTGLIGIITWIPRAILMALLIAVNHLLDTFATLGVGEIDGYIPIIGSINPFHIFFNKIPMINVNFFEFTGVSGTVLTFRTAVAGWYYTMRLIACMVLAVILIYIGIRMAISTIASEKAMYKKMLVDWVTSLALLFLLHYIMLFTFACNDALVKALENICAEKDLTNIMEQLALDAITSITITGGIAAMILYGVIVYQTFGFLFAYVKRMLTVGFLIMIAPLITITYSIDKIGDQKAQALNTWLKEFVYNILIQPFHCILFAAFASVALDLVSSSTTSIAEMLLAICCIQFIKTGEEIIKKIFGFGNASSLSSFAAGTAMTIAALKHGGNAAGAVGAGVAKTKNFIAQNSDKITKATDRLTDRLGKVNKNGELTSHGQKVAERRARRATKKEDEKQIKSGQGKMTDEQRQAAYESHLATKQGDIKRRHDNTQKVLHAPATGVNKLTEKINEARAKNAQPPKTAEQKRRDEAIHIATKKRAQMGDRGGPTENDIQREMKELERKEKEKTARRQEIKGVAKNFWAKNGNTIMSSSLGAVTGIIGFGGGASGAMIGYKIGSGFASGYLKNTHATIDQNTSAAAQPLMQLNKDNDDFDIVAATYGIHATSQNGGFDKVEDKLNEILSAIKGLSGTQKDRFKNDLQMQLVRNPSQFNTEFLESLIDRYGVADEDKDSVLTGMTNYASLAAQVNYAKAINTATGAGLTIDDVANSVERISGDSAAPQGVNTTTTVHTEDKKEVVEESESVEETVVPDKAAEDAAEAAQDQADETKKAVDDLGDQVDEMKRKVEQQPTPQVVVQPEGQPGTTEQPPHINVQPIINVDQSSTTVDQSSTIDQTTINNNNNNFNVETTEPPKPGSGPYGGGPTDNN